MVPGERVFELVFDSATSRWSLVYTDSGRLAA